jgi:hypothetical protein
MKQKLEFTTIAESGLGQFLAKVEKEIERLIQELSSQSKQAQTLESKHALKQFVAISNLLTILNNILPSFECGKDPFKATLILDILKLWGLDKELKDAFITFPDAVYEIAEKELSAFVQQASKAEDFREAIKEKLGKRLNDIFHDKPCSDLEIHLKKLNADIDSFFQKNDFDQQKSKEHAQKLKNFLQAKIIANYTWTLIISHPLVYEFVCRLFILCDETPKNFSQFVSFLNPNALSLTLPKILSMKRVEGSESHFTYNIKFDGYESEEHNLEDLYAENKSEINKILSPALASYFNNYAQSPHVKSEREKMRIIKQFFNNEAVLLSNRAQALRQKLDLVPSKIGQESELQDRIKHLEDLEKEGEQLLREWKTRQENYRTSTLGELAGLAIKKDISHTKERCDINFLDKLLPPSLVVENSSFDLAPSFEIFPLHKKLDETIKNQQDIVRSRLEKLPEKKADCICRYHKDQASAISQQIKVLNDSLRILIQDINNIECAGDLETLQGHSDLLLLKRKLLEEAQAEGQGLLERLNAPWCPPALTGSLAEKIAEEYKNVKMELQACQSHFTLATTVLQQKDLELTELLNNAHAARAIAELMNNLNSQSVQMLKKEKEDLLTIKKAENEKFEHDLANKREELNKHKLEANQWSSDSLAKDQRAKLIQQIISIFNSNTDCFSICQLVEEKTLPDELASNGGIQSLLDGLTSLVQENVLLAKFHALKEKKKLDEEKLKALAESLKVLKSNILVEFRLNSLSALNNIKHHFNITDSQNVGLKVLAKLLELADDSISVDSKSKGVLLAFIEGKQKLLLELISSYQMTLKVIEDELKIKPTLIRFQDQLSDLANLNRQNQAQETAYQEERDKFTTQITDLESAKEATSLSIQSLQDEITILEKINALLERNGQLNAQLSSSHAFSEAECQNAENEFKNINQFLSELKDFIKICQISTYSASVEVIRQLQIVVLERISKARIAHFKNEFNRRMNALKEVEQLAENSLLEGLMAQLASFNHQQAEFAKAFEKNDQLRDELDGWRDLSANKPPAALQNKDRVELADQCNKLKEKFEKISKALLVSYDLQIKEQLKNLEKNFSDSYEDILVHSQDIKKVEDYISSLSSAEGKLYGLEGLLKSLNANSENLKEIEKVKCNIEKLRQNLKDSKAMLEKHTAYLQAREELAEKYSTQFSCYLQQRQAKYVFKDMFYSADARQRQAFISKLNEMLLQFKESGRNQEILSYIEKERSKFPGLTLQPIISRLVFDICQLDKPQEKELISAASQSFEKAFNKLENLKTNLEFVEAMRHLYKRIDDLAEIEGGKEVKGSLVRLTNDLREDLNHFILDNGEAIPSAESFKNFRKLFLDHLHRFDDVMSQDCLLWESLVATFVIALATAGVALAVKFLFTGNYLFFEDTKPLKQIREIEKTLTQVTPAPSS